MSEQRATDPIRQAPPGLPPMLGTSPRSRSGAVFRALLARGWAWLAGPWGIALPVLLLALGFLWKAWATQAPSPDDPAYGIWAARARLRFGPLFDPLGRLGLWSLGETPGWRLLWAALGWSLLAHAIEAGRARRPLAALGFALMLSALGVGALGRYFPPPRSVFLAPGEGRTVEGFWLAMAEGTLSLWRQGDLIGQAAFRTGLPLGLGPYGILAVRSHLVWELQAMGPSGPLSVRAALDAPPAPRLLLHPSPEGESFAAIPEAHWILRLKDGRALTVFEEGTGAVVHQEELPALADSRAIERSLPGGYGLRFTARPVYRLTLFPLPTFLQRALSLALALMGLLVGAWARLRAAVGRRMEQGAASDDGA